MFLLGFARLTRTSTFTSLAVCTAHVSGGKRLPPSRANTANSAIIRRENRLTRGVLWTRHKFSSSLWRKPSEAPFGTTARYRFALRASLCARLTAFSSKSKKRTPTPYNIAPYGRKRLHSKSVSAFEFAPDECPHLFILETLPRKAHANTKPPNEITPSLMTSKLYIFQQRVNEHAAERRPDNKKRATP